jgi:hypothetical protein
MADLESGMAFINRAEADPREAAKIRPPMTDQERAELYGALEATAEATRAMFSRERVSLPPGSDNPPDQAETRFTEADVAAYASDVEAVAKTLCLLRVDLWHMDRTDDFPCSHCRVAARESVGALAEAGRLLPASGEVTEDRGYRRKHRAGDGYTPTLLAGHRPASWQEGAQEMRRTTRRWRDGSQWTGPWEVVE